MSIVWHEGIQIPHNAGSTEDYSFNLSPVVSDTDTMSSASAIATGVTASITSFTPAGFVIFRVSGGTIGVAADVIIRFAMTSGRSQDRSIGFDVKQR